ncbi:MAG: hypothetical protein QOF12_1701, partial [Solirubrobacteraceae bacterium]|nr:hypothetical protein [Solirubrobacteraceae bacterium]
ALLGLGQGAAALFALLAPRSFITDIPVAGAHWVSSFGAYDEHLVRDYGASYAALSALVLTAAWIAERRLVRVALGVWLVAAVPHLVFHLAHADTPAGASGAAAIATLTLTVILPLALFVLVPKEQQP